MLRSPAKSGALNQPLGRPPKATEAAIDGFRRTWGGWLASGDLLFPWHLFRLPDSGSGIFQPTAEEAEASLGSELRVLAGFRRQDHCWSHRGRTPTRYEFQPPLDEGVCPMVGLG